MSDVLSTVMECFASSVLEEESDGDDLSISSDMEISVVRTAEELMGSSAEAEEDDLHMEEDIVEELSDGDLLERMAAVDDDAGTQHEDTHESPAKKQKVLGARWHH
eukprot:EG_transcript_62097